MKLNKMIEILDKYYGADNANKLYCFKSMGAEYLDFQIKHMDKTFFRLFKGDPIAKIYGRILYDTGHYIYKEIGSIDTTYMDNDDNYIVYSSSQLAYSAAIVVDGVSAHDAVDKIADITTGDDEFAIGNNFQPKDKEEAEDKYWWDMFATSFLFTEASLVHDDNKILGQLRINKLNVPFIKNTRTENIMYVKAELPEVLLVDSTLKRFRKITNRIIVSAMQDLFGERSFKVFATNEPYKTQEVVKENGKHIAGIIASSSNK